MLWEDRRTQVPPIQAAGRAEAEGIRIPAAAAEMPAAIRMLAVGASRGATPMRAAAGIEAAIPTLVAVAETLGEIPIREGIRTLVAETPATLTAAVGTPGAADQTARASPMEPVGVAGMQTRTPRMAMVDAETPGTFRGMPKASRTTVR